MTQANESKDTAVTWSVYILACEGGEFYTGMTANLPRRLEEHKAGQGGRFTKISRPVELLYEERFSAEEEAKRREAQLKGWSQRKKLALIAGDQEALKRA